MKLQKNDYSRYIGVDVAKATLQIDDSENRIAASVDNKDQQITDQIIALIDSSAQTLVVCEATEDGCCGCRDAEAANDHQ